MNNNFIMERLIICYDFILRDKRQLSYDSLDKFLSNPKIKKAFFTFYTNSILFFDFKYLDRVEQIRIIKKNGEYIDLRELLSNESNEYTNRQIKSSHIAWKLLINGDLKFKLTI